MAGSSSTSRMSSPMVDRHREEAVHLGRVVRSDSAGVFFGLLALWLCLRLFDDPRTRWCVLAGLGVGLAVSSRYFMVALVPVLVAAAVLADLIAQAERLAGQVGDPKLKLLSDHLADLLRDGFSPVVFEALSIEGGVISPEWLARVAQCTAGGQSEADYRIWQAPGAVHGPAGDRDVSGTR